MKSEQNSAHRVLFVAELSHAAPRVPSITRYLPQFGWECLVLTGTPGIDKIDCPIIETGLPDLVPRFKALFGLSSQMGLQEQLVKTFSSQNSNSDMSSRFVRTLKSILLFPDQHRTWKKSLTKEQVKQIIAFDPEIIVSTSSPVTAHNIAFDLSKQMNIPWIADYRDLWSQNHNYPFGNFRRQLDRIIEHRLLRSAAAIVAVTPGWAVDLRDFHHRDDVFVITNGFDPMYTPKKKNLDPEQFVVVLTGPIYPGSHNARDFLAAVSHCITTGIIDRDSFRVKLFGSQDDYLQSLISQYELSDCVKQLGIIDRSTSLIEQWNANALLLFTWDTDSSKDHLPLRLFEYLATSTPIICTSARDDLGLIDMLETTNKDFVCLSVEEIAMAISSLFSRWKFDLEPIIQTPNVPSPIHSYEKKAEQFAELFSRVLDHDKNI